MTPKRDRSFVTELAGCCGLSGDVDGMDGVEPGDSLRTAKMTGSDQIGLLKITHLMGRDIGIGRTVGRAFGPDLFCSPGAGQDLLDGRDGGKSTEAPSLKLEMDRFGAEARKSGATGLVGRQFVAQGQDFSDQRHRRLVGNPFRRSALVLKPIESKFPIATEPFGHPEAAPMNGPDDFHKSHPVLVKFNGFLSSLVFALDAHRKNLLPVDMGKSLCDEQIAYRCPYGFSLSDVLTETRYPLEKLKTKRAMSIALASFLLLVITPKQNWEGTRSHPSITHRIEKLTRSLLLPENDKFWIYLSCLTLAYLRYERCLLLEISFSSQKALCLKLIDQLERPR